MGEKKKTILNYFSMAYLKVLSSEYDSTRTFTSVVAHIRYCFKRNEFSFSSETQQRFFSGVRIEQSSL